MQSKSKMGTSNQGSNKGVVATGAEKKNDSEMKDKAKARNK